jgi:hypothetical protein
MNKKITFDPLENIISPVVKRQKMLFLIDKKLRFLN